MSTTTILFIILILTIVSAPFIVFLTKVNKQRQEEKAMTYLTGKLFPEGEQQRDVVIGAMMELTGNRFTQDEMLDFYIKTKGLQLVDINAFGDDALRDYLMKPTRIRLHYDELVIFYERYLNLPQGRGVTLNDADCHQTRKESAASHTTQEKTKQNEQSE